MQWNEKVCPNFSQGISLRDGNERDGAAERQEKILYPDPKDAINIERC